MGAVMDGWDVVVGCRWWWWQRERSVAGLSAIGGLDGAPRECMRLEFIPRHHHAYTYAYACACAYAYACACAYLYTLLSPKLVTL